MATAETNDPSKKPTAPAGVDEKGKHDVIKTDADPSTKHLEGTESGRRTEALSKHDASVRGGRPTTMQRVMVAVDPGVDDIDFENALFEVMIDQWGNSKQMFRRGDLLRGADCVFDIEHAYIMKQVRLAPEYERLPVAHATMPLTPAGSIDTDVQRSARAGTSAEAKEKAND